MAQVAHLTPAIHVPPTAHVVFDGASKETKAQLAARVATMRSIDEMASVFSTLTEEDAVEVAQMAIAMGAPADWVSVALDMGKVRRGRYRKVAVWWGVLGTVSMAASAYHGYKRNQSIGWALAWGLAGALFPVITPTIAVAQGFGKRKR